jgi:hypothetical protein
MRALFLEIRGPSYHDIASPLTEAGFNLDFHSNFFRLKCEVNKLCFEKWFFIYRKNLQGFRVVEHLVTGFTVRLAYSLTGINLKLKLSLIHYSKRERRSFSLAKYFEVAGDVNRNFLIRLQTLNLFDFFLPNLS